MIIFEVMTDDTDQGYSTDLKLRLATVFRHQNHDALLPILQKFGELQPNCPMTTSLLQGVEGIHYSTIISQNPVNIIK